MMTSITNHPPPRKKRRKTLRLLVLLVAGLFVLTAACTQLFLSPMILRKLEATVAAHLDASLSVGTLTYRPPFTVHLYDVHFLAHPGPSGGTELLAAKRIDLSLARLPLGRGPLIIERFAIAGLTLHVIRNPQGDYVGLDLARKPAAPSSSAAMKLSDVLRLRHFNLQDGKLIYQDQTDPHAPSTVWQGINSDISLAPRSASSYDFGLQASDEPIARARVDGVLDVDSLLLQIKKLTASIQAPGAPSASAADPLPPELSKLVHRYAVQGTIHFATAGTIPLKNPLQTSLASDLSVEGGGATVPGSGERLNDLAVTAHVERNTSNAPGQQVRVQLQRFRAVSGGAVLQLNTALGLLDPSTGKWSMSALSGALDAPRASQGPWNLTGHADFHADIAHDPQTNRTPFVGVLNLVGIYVHPPDLAAAIEGLTGTIRIAGNDPSDRQITLQNVAGRYGGDKLALDHAIVGLQQFPDRILVSDIQSHVNLVQDAPACPGDLGDVLQTFQPSGPFTIVGVAAMQHVVRDDGPGYSPEWDLTITTDGGAVALLNERLPVTGLTGQMRATKHAISIAALKGTLLGGAMSLAGNARVVEPIVYQGQFGDRGASVGQFAQAFNLKTPDGRLPSGAANLGFKFFSQSPAPTNVAPTNVAPTNVALTNIAPTTARATTQPISAADEWLGLLGGDGSLQIDNGNLWALPALQSLTHHTRVAREALTAGEAAAVFSVANRTIYFKHVAIYSPALGLQGSGSETFDGNLNLDIIAAPLGDWKRKLAETDIPIFSHVLSAAAGSIEKFVGNATSELLYHFRITGTRDNPVVETVPAPFITDSAASLFAKMIHHDDSTKLVDAVNEK